MAGTEESNLSLMFAVGTIGMLILAIAVILFVIVYQKKLLHQQVKMQKLEADYQRQLLEASITSQEGERKRIASDLHDEVGALLSAVKLNINFILTHHKNKQDESEMLGEAKGMIDEAISSVRRISKDLLPATLEQFGLEEALKELCAKVNKGSPVNIVFANSAKQNRLSKNVELSLYRIVQELLNNALKHAGANQINVNLASEEKRLILIVEDDGVGFDFEMAKARNPAERGVGLFNLESRASLIGASLDFAPGSLQGTKAKLSLQL